MSQEIIIKRLSGFGRGKSVSFSGSKIVLGTDVACHVQFDPTWDKTVSPQHAVISRQSDGWWLEDQSRDGSWIKGQRLSNRKLESGSEIELGKGGPKVQVDFQPLANDLAKTTKLPLSEILSATPGAAATDQSPVSKKGASRRWIMWGAGLAGGFLLLVLMWWIARAGGANPDEQLTLAARKHEAAVGVVIVAALQDNAESKPIATAWALGNHVFATSAQAADSVAQVLQQGGAAFVVLNKQPELEYHWVGSLATGGRGISVLNKHPELKFRVIRAVAHPKYARPVLNVEGKETAVPAYDVGIFYVEETAVNKFKPAPKAELEKLDSGYRIACLGFPMAGLAGQDVNVHDPVANMQSGILTSASDYWLSKAVFADRLLLQHNLGATGGASGSPVFNVKGQVVGILSSGNTRGPIRMSGGKVEVENAPSATTINFAHRVDLLKDIYPDYKD